VTHKEGCQNNRKSEMCSIPISAFVVKSLYFLVLGKCVAAVYLFGCDGAWRFVWDFRPSGCCVYVTLWGKEDWIGLAV
jgi:hypothetical protein